MPKDIEEILTGKDSPADEKPAADPPKEEVKAEGEAPPEKAEVKLGDTGQDAPDEGDEPAGPDPARQNAGLKAAATAERKKRQELEQQLEALRKEAAERDQWHRQQSENWQRQVAQFAPKPPEAPKVNLFEDPDAWMRQSVQQPLQSVERKLTFQMSERLARFQYKEEYGEAEKWAEASLSQNPAHPLRHLLANSDDPGETLVMEYRKNKLAAEMADPAAYEQKVLEKLLADPAQKQAILERLGAEPLKKAPPTQQPAPTDLPSNLAGTRSVGGSKGPAWQGPRPLGEIISGKR